MYIPHALQGYFYLGAMKGGFQQKIEGSTMALALWPQRVNIQKDSENSTHSERDLYCTIHMMYVYRRVTTQTWDMRDGSFYFWLRKRHCLRWHTLINTELVCLTAFAYGFWVRTFSHLICQWAIFQSYVKEPQSRSKSNGMKPQNCICHGKVLV